MQVALELMYYCARSGDIVALLMETRQFASGQLFEALHNISTSVVVCARMVVGMVGVD